jgi:HD-GYP domain-containing protein (c-di-GMP phosphodiesterase class II)
MGRVTALDNLPGTHDRPYRKGRSVGVAIAEPNRFAGRQFDGDLVELFVARRGQLASEPEMLLAPLIRGFAHLER